VSEPVVLKQEVLAYAGKMVRHGFVAGRGGNVSCRIAGRDGVVITPSRADYDTLKVEDICVVDFDLIPEDAARKPSVEAGLHVAVYRDRPEINAVIHTHQIFASVLSLIGWSVPSLFDEQVFYLGPTIELIPYAPSGSQEMIHNVRSALLSGCNAYILQNHGALCLGAALKEAFHNVQLLERAAQTYFYARLSKGKISGLPPEAVNYFLEMRRDEQKKRGH
jgi:L-ribulose-5-phosphate 4-epimerase